MTLAVSAATGQLGRLVFAGLEGRTDVVALARDPARAADLGFPVRAADYAKTETLAPALDGVARLLLISSSEVGQRAPQHRNVIAAARAAGVGQVIYTSLLHADRSPLSLAEEHRDTEAALKASGLDHVILRNGWYTENYLGALPAALAHGALVGSAGTGRIASAARADYAAAAVAVLTGEGFAGRTLELAGDDAWTLADLAAEVSRQTGRTIPYHDLPQADYAAILEGAGLPAGLAAAIASWDVGASKGALFDDGRTLSRLIGRPTTPLAASVAAALATVPA
jgi:NAD(P)H dehydrogenase (quinone)